tara:strand:- start:3673 stop:3861 length:189 start_codon:yes stop_codon:yes gene_type:complete
MKYSFVRQTGGEVESYNVESYNVVMFKVIMLKVQRSSWQGGTFFGRLTMLPQINFQFNIFKN